MKVSVCIPNYNYGRYIGRTIRSVLEQSHRELEIIVADNASTDESVQVVQSFGDPRIRLRVNACNVGFARNLDKAAALAAGDRMIMLSSDDLMRPEALATYARLAAALGAGAASTLLGSTVDVIDPEDRITGTIEPDPDLWAERQEAPELSAAVGAPVYRLEAPRLLRRCLETMRTPIPFASTCYPRALYERVEGYGGSRQINPDKWFAWRLLGVAEQVCVVARPLFAYRWHPANQTTQQAASGALKLLVDDYTATFEVDAELLGRAGLDRERLVAAFVEYVIARHGLATLARGERRRARRMLTFGRAVYPEATFRNGKTWALECLLRLGPLGAWAAQLAYRRRRRVP